MMCYKNKTIFVFQLALFVNNYSIHPNYDKWSVLFVFFYEKANPSLLTKIKQMNTNDFHLKSLNSCFKLTQE